MVLYDSIQNKSQKGFVMSIKEYFKFEERKTSYFTETLAGFTTFLTMAYIIILNPSVLSQTGMDFNGVFFATIIATIVGCLFMGIFANYPIAIAPGLAMNAYFSFVVVISIGIPWQEVLGMIITSILSFLFGYISLPDTIFSTPELGNTFMQMDIMGAISHNLYTIIFTFFIVTLFDTTGTMLGIAKQAGLMKNDTFPNVKSALLADSIASLVGSIFGTSPTSAYVESGSGVASGGRTGFVNVIIALLFLLMLFTAPIAKVLSTVPAVTAPALIGFYMMSSLSRINWDDMQEAFPAFLIFLMMPLSYSITDAVGIGIISYCLIKIFSGKIKQVHPLLYVFMLLFIIQFVVLNN